MTILVDSGVVVVFMFSWLSVVLLSIHVVVVVVTGTVESVTGVELVVISGSDQVNGFVEVVIVGIVRVKAVVSSVNDNLGNIRVVAFSGSIAIDWPATSARCIGLEPTRLARPNATRIANKMECFILNYFSI